MNNKTNEKIGSDWECADEMFYKSRFAETFEVDDCEYDSDLDMFYYFDMEQNVLVVDVQTGEVYMKDSDEIDTVYLMGE